MSLVGLGRQLKRDVDALGPALCTDRKPAALEYLEHRRIFGQHFGDELLERSGARNPDQVGDQVRGNTAPLMPVVDCERNLRATRLHDDVPCATRNHLLPPFGKHSDQCYVALEVDIEKELYFPAR